ncbi:PDDEXK family nuclease [Halorussus litoreus]|uniref:hypothetical protein n=1 Tax=Halorussus litoreus TaxID=1710536 RepID=UPI0013009C1C|nr:hypothetical protein [Halorussus litoreus]
MTNTVLEAALQGIGDGARLEQLASDLLRREGYDVDPTGTRGPDGGRDSFLYQDEEDGILHCSISANLESKVKSDAEKVSDRQESFDFFIFATTQNPAAIKRDRIERELEDEYGWRVRIWDFERLRNRLMGDTENHGLAIDHLSVTPGKAFEDVSEQVDELYQSFIQRLHNREAPSGTIRDNRPLVAVHLIPIDALEESHDKIAMDLPNPPAFNSRTGLSDQFGRMAVTGDSSGLGGEPFRHYVGFHVDGWMEAVSTSMTFVQKDTPKISYTFDPTVVDFVDKALDCYEEAEIPPPFYLYVTLIDAEQHIMSQPDRMWGADSPRPLRTNEFTLNRVTLNGYDVDVPSELRKSFYLLWNQLGWEIGSIHYNEETDDETEEKKYEWEPYD